MLAPGGLHEQWPSDTTMPTWAMPAFVVLVTVTLKGTGGPPGRTVVGPGAAMVTSMPPADPCDEGWAPGDVDEVTGLDGDADCPAVVVPDVPEALDVPELVVVPEFEQPTRATNVAAPINVAASLEEVFMTPSPISRGGDAAQV
jgi:hypothetical protein